MGWEAQPWRIREGSLAGGGEMKVPEQNRGRHGRVSAGKRQAGQLAEGHGEVSSRLAKEKRRVETASPALSDPRIRHWGSLRMCMGDAGSKTPG